MEADRNDFEAFFDEHYGAVLRSVALAIGDAGRAEDLTQEAFARAFRHWSKVATLDRPIAWVYVVALNAERSRWRRERRAPAVEPAPVTVPDASSSVVSTIIVRDALDRLPPRQRCAIVLRYLGDLTVADIASVMGCAEGTVKATLHRALAHLRVDLDGSDE
ncbi:MAG TPA: SigE family RNA polymerase sigma factor [Acidimicrobiia bacterium]|nr:SigE family RNA polymerase sigma factor [Acidimicrobiia bacterium]